MGSFIPAFFSSLAGGTLGAGAGATAIAGSVAAKGVTALALTAGAKEVAKSMAPKAPKAPTVLQPEQQSTEVGPSAPTAISVGTKGEGRDGSRADLLSTILAGSNKKKNQLG